jgi:hypothetical protein
MTAQPLGPDDGHGVIHLAARVSAVVVPIGEFRILPEPRRNATPEGSVSYGKEPGRGQADGVQRSTD